MFRDASPTIGKCLMINVRISDLSGEQVQCSQSGDSRILGNVVLFALR